MALVPPPTLLEVFLAMLLYHLGLVGLGPGVSAPNAPERTTFVEMAYLWKVQVAREAETAKVLMDPHSIDA